MRLVTERRPGRIALTAVAAIVTAILGAGPAVAATTWTVTPGGRFSGQAGTTKLEDTTDGASLICSGSVLSGSFKAGSGLSGTGIGSITSGGKFTDCTGPTPLPYTITLRGLPWHISVTSYRDGVVRGRISHIEITVSLGGNCSFVLDGTAAGAFDGITRFTYTDSAHTLKLLPTGASLHYYKVAGCAQIVHNGDTAGISATYPISPAQAITSP